ncbi:PQQ-dependent sugar dehydrogenase [Actinomadura sp. ATCC 31491]|uniref:PQQ-dependent sugar dehydrogenase n=1 Tax=Actinomadura luzonensis TaxID=2805427 RepID=A0ABT0FKF5_9ACTN|nr:PQQ-dependent sugar dehydrogenase [Actinomadura luzonensis]MCK2212784.1 PQQ-dependent sugar dehydrogenase [Actinomadura luzonensis]
MRKLWTLALLATLTTTAACSGGGGAAPAAPATRPGAAGDTTPAAPPTAAPTATVTGAVRPGTPKDVATGLAVPWAIAFLPGGDALVTERDSARLLRVTASGRASEVARIGEARPDGEGGLMGVAVKDRQVFLYYTAEQDNRVVRYAFDGERLGAAKVLVQGIPKGGIHNGGRLALGPDGYLYATTGETGDRPLAQDRGSLAGKILRLTTDGAPAPGNPFGTLVYSYGHRNVQGLAWDQEGRLYASEFGQNTWDEVNQIKPGGNYGWPEVEGRGDDSRYVNPIATWPTSDASPSGMAYAGGSLWVGALRGQRLWQIPLSADGSPGRPVAHYTGRYGRLRAVTATPDGSALWVGTSNEDGRGAPRQGDDRVLSVPLS